jgi:hypothetical protein
MSDGAVCPLPQSRVNAIVVGRRHVSANTAFRLARYSALRQISGSSLRAREG